MDNTNSADVKQICKIPDTDELTIYTRKELEGFHPVGMEASGKYYILCGRTTLIPLCYKEDCSFNLKMGKRRKKIYITENTKDYIDLLCKTLTFMGTSIGYVVLMHDKELVAMHQLLDNDSDPVGWTFCREDGSDITEFLVMKDRDWY